MSGIEPKYRRPLNAEQIEILELLYKFRFGTASLIKDYFLNSNPGMNVFRRLAVLSEQGFITKRYLADYQLLHKPVIYYLSPIGAKVLQEYRDADDRDEISFTFLYRNKTVKEAFVSHYLHVFGLHNQLTDKYGEALDFLAKNDLVNAGNLPNPLPDGFLQLQDNAGTTHFFLDYLEEGQQYFAISKRIRQYVTYRQKANWNALADQFPTILLVCESDRVQRQAEKRAKAILNKTWESDIKIIAVTKGKLSLSPVS